MCGEVEDNSQIGAELHAQVHALARGIGLVQQASAELNGPSNLESVDGRATYSSELFDAGLRRVLADLAHADENEMVDAIACQAIAFARLAGFVAAQLPPEADLYRTVIDALTSGHAETTQIAREHHAQDHHHYHHH